MKRSDDEFHRCKPQSSHHEKANLKGDDSLNSSPSETRKCAVSFRTGGCNADAPRGALGGQVCHSLSTLSLTTCGTTEPLRRHGKGSMESLGSRIHSKSSRTVPSQQTQGRLRQCRSQPILDQEPLVHSDPHWPAGMNVVISRVKHIPNLPPEPEPFYQPTFQEMKPPVFGEKKGLVVYKYKPKPSYCFTTALLGSTKRTEERIDLSSKGVDDSSLGFEARFEGGNLEKAIRVSPYSYELYLRGDLFCHCHVHWFYFQVRNIKAGLKYRFSIVNFRKTYSLYNNGLRPLMYSERKAEEENIGWHRVGEDVCFYKNNVRYSDTANYHTLTFTIEFPYENDTVYFAHCYPYTYSDLMDYLQELSRDSSKTSFCSIRTLCHSLTGNPVPVISINTDSSFAEERKKKVVITARVHPGETNSSWILKGFLDFLTGTHNVAQSLRSTYSFEIVPMLNPDGVIVGNSRCSLSGRDLNRQYFSGLQNVFPTVWHTKQMVLRLLQDEYDIDLFCDIHGHGCKQNMFLYGCSENPDDTRNHLFFSLLQQHAPDLFNIQSCHSRIEARKEGAARIVMWRLGIKNSFTLESITTNISSARALPFAHLSLMYACTDDTSDDTGEDLSQHSSHSRHENSKGADPKKRTRSTSRSKRPPSSTFKKGQCLKAGPYSPRKDCP